MDITYDVTNTLRAQDHGHPPLIVTKVYDSYRRHNYEEMGDVCQTVSSFYGTGGGNVPIVLRYEDVQSD